MPHIGTRPIWDENKLEELKTVLLTAKTWHEAALKMHESTDLIRTVAYKNDFPRPMIKRGGNRRKR
jgi:hypothetical protein